MKKFKYLGKVSSDFFLKNLTIRFSQPGAFNDPFELQPEFYNRNGALKSGEDYPCKLVLHGCDLVSEKYLIKDHLSETQIEKIDSIRMLSTLNEELGILCLTQADTLIPANFLMWAHYAESHQGIVIEFKSNCSFVETAMSVQYVKRRPILDANLLIENKYVSIGDLYFKSDKWAYENEIRIAKKLDLLEKTKDTDVLGFQIYVTSVPIQEIECVYVGCNASADLKEMAYRAHQEKGLKVMFLRVHQEEYKLIPYTQCGYSWADTYSLHEQLLFEREKI